MTNSTHVEEKKAPDNNVGSIFTRGSEAYRFGELVSYAHAQYAATQRNPAAAVSCKTNSEARSIRRKFYRLRELFVTMPDAYKLMHAIRFNLNGPRVDLVIKNDWIRNVGVPQNVSTDDEHLRTGTSESIGSSIPLPGGDRQHDEE